MATTVAAIVLVESTRKFCEKRGFESHKFLIKQRESTFKYPTEEIAKGIQGINLVGNSFPIKRAPWAGVVGAVGKISAF